MCGRVYCAIKKPSESRESVKRILVVLLMFKLRAAPMTYSMRLGLYLIRNENYRMKI